MTLPGPEVVMPKLFGLYGGKDKFFEAMDQRRKEFFDLWDQNSEAAGRVLRAHLIVEHFLTAHLQAANPKLGSLIAARTTFAQKIALISDDDATAALMRPGLSRLNAIRNKLAHRLRVELNEDDVKAFLSVGLYEATLKEKKDANTADPLWVLEDFAKFAGTLLQSSASSDAKLWAEAFGQTTASAGVP